MVNSKPFTRVLLTLVISALLVIPAVSLAEIGNSDTIKENLNESALSTLTINAEGLDIALHGTKDAPYAELDATVIGINSADVEYGMTVTESDGGTIIDAHHKGTDIGINHVKLEIYVPESSIETLKLNLTSSDLTDNELNLATITGSTSGGKLHVKDGQIGTLDLQLDKSELSFAGQVDTVRLTTTDGSVHIDSSVVPATLDINGSGTKVTLAVPDTALGFTLHYDLANTKANSIFFNGFSETTGTETYGSGGGTFTVKLTDGELHLNKK